MSRDMKPRKSQPARKKAAGGTLIGMFIGLVLGIAVAAGVVFYLNNPNRRAWEERAEL